MALIKYSCFLLLLPVMAKLFVRVKTIHIYIVYQRSWHTFRTYQIAFDTES